MVTVTLARVHESSFKNPLHTLTWGIFHARICYSQIQTDCPTSPFLFLVCCVTFVWLDAKRSRESHIIYYSRGKQLSEAMIPV